jgi:hypothetical protein
VIFAVGGLVAWLRLQESGAPADQALGVIPDQTLLAMGSQRMLLPVALAVTVTGIMFWFESRRPRAVTRRPTWARTPRWMPRVSSRARAAVGWVAARRHARTLFAPIRWYLRWVPQIAWLWLPLSFFMEAPVTQVIFFVNLTVASAIGNWAAGAGANVRGKLLRVGLSLVALSVCVSLLHEWHRPRYLPVARVSPASGPAYEADYIAVDGGQAYLVRQRHLTVVPMAGLRSLVVRKPPEREDNSPSPASRVWRLVS